MRDPSSAVAKDIDGAANVITAAICALTHGRPGGVCRSAGVRATAGSIQDMSVDHVSGSRRQIRIEATSIVPW